MNVVQDEALARALRILKATTEFAEGAGFVDALARGLARAFAVPGAMVVEVDPDEPDIGRPLAAWIDDAPARLPPYQLRGTPCFRAIGGQVCVFPGEVQALFPEDRMLVELAVESYAGVAVRGRGGAVIGLIGVFDRVARPDLVALEPVLSAFAAQAGWNIERARLELHLRRSLARSRALTRIATRLHTAHADPDAAFVEMCAEVREVLDVTGVSVTLIDAQTGALRRCAHAGLPQRWLERGPITWLDGTQQIGEHRLVRREHIEALPPGSSFREFGLTGAALAELRHEGALLGFLTAVQFGGERVLTAEDLAWLDAVGGMLGQVVSAGRLVEALRRSEQEYRRIVTTTHEGVWTVDHAQRTTFVNQRMAEIVGYEVEEMIGRPLHEFVAPEDHGLIASKFAERRGGVHDRYEHRYLRKDGARVTAQVSTSPLLDEAGAFVGALAMVRDVTELRQLEARMLHAQKLESLGVLAGGIAHDFNNLLVGIVGNVGLARQELAADAPAQAYLRDLERAATRASDLTAQMLAYAGKVHFVGQRIDLNRLLVELSPLLTTMISREVQLRTELAADLPAIEGDATQIRQVVVNLVANASDAIGDGPGVISLSSELVRADDALLASTYSDELLPPGNYVCLHISDTGCGFDEATRARIFDPFFTTKFAGRGLGLAAVLGILRGHHGAIAVQAAPEQGARFSVLLPAVKTQPAPPPRPVDGAGAGEGLVLVADDEAAVRTVARRVLERAGFTVCMAADGREAVEVFAARQAEIRAVLLDMTMPLLRGDEVYRELRRLRADVHVVLSSGFSDPSLGAGLSGPFTFLAKPWTPQELLTALREALAQK